MKQLIRIFLSIILLFGVCDQILLGQQERAKAEICNEQLLPLYKAYFEEKDKDERYKKAKLYLEKVNQIGCGIEEGFINPNVRQFVKRIELTQIYNKCADADKAYFSKPDLANLNSMVTACDLWVEKSPTPDVYYTTHLANATGFALLAGIYKDTDQPYSYTEKALEKLTIETTPADWTEENWRNFRKENIGKMLQYQGLCKLRQPKPDAEAAIMLLTKVADLRDGAILPFPFPYAYRESYTYLLRAEAYLLTCPSIKKTLEEKNQSTTSSIPLKEACPNAVNILHDYARTLAITFDNPVMKKTNDNAYEEAQVIWSFLYPGSTSKKLDDLINFYKAEFRKK